MSNLKQLRNRIKIIKSTQKITKAMQMVAASNLKKMKDKISDSSIYLEVLNNIINQASYNDNIPQEMQKFFTNSSLRSVLFIVVTSERGLCGSFNSSIIKKLRLEILEAEKARKSVKLIIVGKKGHDALKGKYIDYIDSYFPASKDEIGMLPLRLSQRIAELFVSREAGSCYIYFNKFKNALTQVFTKEQLFPVKHNSHVKYKRHSAFVSLHASAEAGSHKISDQAWNDNTTQNNDYGNFEYEGEGLIKNIIDLYINAHVNFSLLQSKAGEEGARMTAMDSATKNAGDMIDSLTLKLNRSRQAIITKELTEIISGVEAA